MALVEVVDVTRAGVERCDGILVFFGLSCLCNWALCIFSLHRQLIFSSLLWSIFLFECSTVWLRCCLLIPLAFSPPYLASQPLYFPNCYSRIVPLILMFDLSTASPVTHYKVQSKDISSSLLQLHIRIITSTHVSLIHVRELATLWSCFQINPKPWINLSFEQSIYTIYVYGIFKTQHSLSRREELSITVQELANNISIDRLRSRHRLPTQRLLLLRCSVAPKHEYYI